MTLSIGLTKENQGVNLNPKIITMFFDNYYMDNYEYHELIKNIVKEKEEVIEEKVCPQLSSLFSRFSLSYNMFYGVALKKSFIQEDPYSDAAQLKELTVPKHIKVDPLNPPMDAETSDFYSVEFSLYSGILKFINENYKFTVKSFTIRELNRLMDIVKYINWTSLFSIEETPTTKFAGEIFTKFRQTDERMVSSMGIDSMLQCRKTQDEIVALIKEIYFWKKNEQKINFRNLLNEKHISIKKLDSFNDYFDILSKELVKNGIKVPLKDLIVEIYNEDFSIDSKINKSNNIKILSECFTNLGSDEKKEIERLKGFLVNILPIIGRNKNSILSALSNIKFNSNIILKKPKSLKKHENEIKVGIRGGFNTVIYVLKSPKDKEPNINIDITQFEYKVSEKVIEFESLETKVGTIYANMISMDNNKLYQAIVSFMSYLEDINLRFLLFDTFFKAIKFEDAEFDMFLDISLEIKKINIAIEEIRKELNIYNNGVKNQKEFNLSQFLGD